MRSGSERMHTWRRTPSTGRNFQTLIIWITVSYKASCNGSISVIFFFFDFFNFCRDFQKFPSYVSPVYEVVSTVNVYLVSQKFSTAISKGLSCVDPSSMIFRDIKNYLPVNTSPYKTSGRLYFLNKLLRLHGAASKFRDKLICYWYIHCCCCIHCYIINHTLFWITSYLQILGYN